MKRAIIIIFSALLGALLLSWPAAVFAAPPAQEEPDPEVIWQDLTLTSDYDIDPNMVVNGNVVVFDGELDLEGKVRGDVTIFGGELDLSGEIDGELVVVGGHLTFEEGAAVSGECFVVGGAVDDDGGGILCTTVLPGALGESFINGLGAALPEFAERFNVPVPDAPHPPDAPEISGLNEGENGRPAVVPPVPPHVERPEGKGRAGFFGRFFGAFGRALLAGFTAFVIAAVFPARLAEVSDAVSRKPAAAGTIGFLTAIAAVSLIALTSIIWAPLLLILTLVCGLGILLGLAGAGFLGGTVVFSWTAVGALLGERLAGWLNIRKPTYPVLAALGTAAMTLGIGLLGLLPLTPEGLLSVVIFSIGLGGVVLTRYGRQPYPPLGVPVDPVKVREAVDNMPDDNFV